VEIYEDPTARLDLAQVLSSAGDRFVAPSPGRELAEGMSHSALWLRFRLEVSEPGRGTPWLLEVAKPNLDHVDLYIPRRTEPGAQVSFVRKTAGDMTDQPREVRFRTFVFRLPPDFASDSFFYLRLKSATSLNLPLLVWPEPAFLDQALKDLGLLSLIHGIIAAMILYNLFIFISLKDRAYLLYVLYISSILVYQLRFYGLTSVIGDLPAGWGPRLIWLSLGSAFIWIPVFARNFLNTRALSPGIDKVLQVYIGLGAAALVIGLAGFHYLATYLGHFLGMTASLLLISIAWAAYRRGFKPAVYFVLAWAFMLAGTLLFTLGGSFIPRSPITFQALPVGSAMESILLSFALAARIKRLREDREAARAANRAKSDFMAFMSHEIKTPMNSLLGAADLLAQSDLTPGQAEYVENLKASGRGLQMVINDVLDLSRLEAGRVRLEKKTFLLEEALDQVLELIGVEARAKGLKLGLHLGEGLPAGLVGDPVRLRQILINLLGNAVKFTKSGEISLVVEPDQSRPGGLLFKVRDTGIGIPPAKQKAVFEPFTQADQSITRQYGGTGLGLSIVQGLVELMGGRVWLESRPGQGTTVSFTALFDPAETPPRPPAPEPVLRDRPAAGPAEGELPALRLLLVDDHPANLRLIELFLKGTPLEVDLAESGDKALEMVELFAYDLILMDLEMPGMDGYATLEAVRALEAARSSSPSIPVIALTAHDSPEDVRRCLEAGFSAHLAKPITSADLLETILEHGPPELPPPPPGREMRLDPILAELAGEFVESARKDCREMRRALEWGEYRVIHRLAHGLKGNGGSYGLAYVSQMGAAICRLVDRARVGVLPAALDRLEEYLGSLELKG